MNRIIPKTIALAAFFGFTTMVNAQEHHCGTTERLLQIYKQHPELAAKRSEFMHNVFSQPKKSGTRSAVYTIPVVFHVIHKYGIENISDAQIFDEVNNLNENFNKMNADTIDVIPEFDSLIADCKIQFRLATLDPDGNCTNGITRHYSHETTEGDDYSKMSLWPRDKYLNIWVIAETIDDVAAYAYHPTDVAGTLAFADGIIVLHNYVGSIGTGSYAFSKTLTHEIGHWLSLPHTWGDNNTNGATCGDDLIPDTPITKGSPTGNCTLDRDDCNPGIIENVQNYMDYSYCNRMFTIGQAEVMTLTLNSDISFRKNLWQPENLVATGTDVLTTPLCTPVADFRVNEKYICLGDAVTFIDESWRGAVTSYSWNFPGGTSSMLTSPNPVVTYNTPGWHNVTLTVTNAAGSDTKTITHAVYVSNGYADFYGATVENFENVATEPWWISDNDENNEAFWHRVSIPTAPSGTYCFELNNNKDLTIFDYTYFDKLGGSVDALISPSYNLEYTSGAVLSFKYSCASHATLMSEMTEELRVYSTIDCGKTWVPRAYIAGTELVNGGIASGNYVPANSTSFWTTKNISLGVGIMQPNVRFKFEYTASDKSNNIYLDDININGINSVSETAEAPFSFDVYPNPASPSENLTVAFTNETGVMNIVLNDILGNVVYTQTVTEKGDNVKINVPLNALNISKGVYVVSLSNEVYKQTKRIIVD
ncbi:MAG TPA: M43 family zinc metalloprotease [Flavobacteriales bacterium]|nr:M43 family zinc metalloprotease [Flavobacteriales bacterium]